MTYCPELACTRPDGHGGDHGNGSLEWARDDRDRVIAALKRQVDGLKAENSRIRDLLSDVYAERQRAANINRRRSVR